MGRKKQPIAQRVVVDDLGPSCAICHGLVYLDRVVKGEMIFRHVDQVPWNAACQDGTTIERYR